MLEAKKEDWWTIPNILTYFRLLCVPAFAVLFFVLKGDLGVYVGLGVFLIAELTDIVDGKIARKFNMTTDVGRAMDPLADKLLQMTAIVCLSIKGLMFWPFAVVLVVKELYMICGSIILLKMNVIGQANAYGKYAATVLGYSMIACFFHPFFYEKIYLAVFDFRIGLDWIGMIVGLCIAVYAAYFYTKTAYTTLRDRKDLGKADRIVVDYSVNDGEADPNHARFHAEDEAQDVENADESQVERNDSSDD